MTNTASDTPFSNRINKVPSELRAEWREIASQQIKARAYIALKKEQRQNKRAIRMALFIFVIGMGLIIRGFFIVHGIAK